ncbi:MAG: dihydropteroate synthase [bacterium]|nr:dihydropteroate synthase [bacterium]
MLAIGERINVRTKLFAEAFKERNFEPIKDMAIRQVKGGANMLDINIGPARKDGPELMAWLVENIQKVVDVPLCLDTTNVEAIEAGLSVHKGKAMINSTSADPERLSLLMPLAAKYNAMIIGLTLASGGLPRDANERCALAAEIMAAGAEHGVPMEDIYLDPIMVPINGQQEQVKEILEAIRMFREMNDPPMNSVIGLSNISNGAPENMRSLINHTFLTMAITMGLTAAIVDTLDPAIIQAIKTTSVILNQSLYCHSYLETC